MSEEMKMLDKLTPYVWMIAFVLIAYPYNTASAQVDTPSAGQIWKEPMTDMELSSSIVILGASPDTSRSF